MQLARVARAPEGPEKAAGKPFLSKGMEIVTKPFTMDVLATKVREMIEAAPRE